MAFESDQYRSSQLVYATKIDRPEWGLWRFGLCEAAGEGGGSFHHVAQPKGRTPGGDPGDQERVGSEAGRRARSKIRRYCAANRLNRLVTLTYRGEGCHDRLGFRSDIGAFFRKLKRELGEPFPYVWVPEWHPGGHGLHAHAAVGQYVRRGLIDECWAKGFIHIKLLGDLPVGSGGLEESRVAARYLAKYAGKEFDEAKGPGLHRYDVARGYSPGVRMILGETVEEVIDEASGVMGYRPQIEWRSNPQEGWLGPPAVWASW
jgi:hypothetical protein